MPTRPGATYYLTYSQQTYIDDPGEQSDEPYSWQGVSRVNVYPRALHRSEPTGEHVSISPDRTVYAVDELSPGAVAFVVIANYQDGDTFGSSGYWEVAGVASTPEDAKKMAAAAEDERTAVRSADPSYRPWDGYFASLNSVEIVPMVVLS